MRAIEETEEYQKIMSQSVLDIFNRITTGSPLPYGTPFGWMTAKAERLERERDDLLEALQAFVKTWEYSPGDKIRMDVAHGKAQAAIRAARGDDAT